ncbi:hypothetical protein PYCC9005_005255 [Savitreella phatthalungensis]
MHDGKTAMIHTGFLKSTHGKAQRVPLSDLYVRRELGPSDAADTSIGGSYVQLLRRKQLIGYLLDRRGAFLGGPAIMNEMFRKTNP